MPNGTIQNRNAFLMQIAGKLGRNRIMGEVQKPEWSYQPQWDVYKDYSQDELLPVLKKACESIHTQVIETTSAELRHTLQDTIETYGGGPIIAGKDERFHEFGLDDVFSSNQVKVWDISAGKENIDYAAKANIGLSVSDITLAESGTAIFFNDKNRARAITLLPIVSIVIIPKSSLVARLTQATEIINSRVEAGGNIVSYVNMISGPSNSADIEMNIVVGVHGPVKVAYLVVADS